MNIQAVSSQRTGLSPDFSGKGEEGRVSVPLRSQPGASVTEGVFSPSSQSQNRVARGVESSSDSGVVSRVMSDIDSVGSVPAQVSVYSQPMGRSIMTDVVVHQTDNDDGTRKIGNHWKENAVSASVPASSSPEDGIGVAGLRVGAYEESRLAAREAYMMFQGMKVNQTV